MSVKDNLAKIEAKVKQVCERANRSYEDITIIAVTKYVTIERTEEAIAAGINHLGENRTDEMLRKYEHIQNKANWHFIGTLQSRKVKEVVNEVAAIHSLDRLSVAKQINSRSNDVKDCFIQVNVSGEESKHGLAPEEVLSFIKELEPFEKVRVVGLMTMAPHIKDREEIRMVFKRLAQLRDTVASKQYTHAPCTNLSMGMSNDFDIAIEEGATHIRVGSKLVGSTNDSR